MANVVISRLADQNLIIARGLLETRCTIGFSTDNSIIQSATTAKVTNMAVAGSNANAHV